MRHQIAGWATLWVAALMTLSTTAEARLFKVKPISEESYSRLNEEARSEYDRAYQLADHILYDQALNAAERAVELQPSSVELRFFVLRLASFLAEVNLESNAVSYLERAANQCQAILEMEGIPPTLRDRVREEYTKFTDRAENIYRRDELRKSWGAEIAKEHVRTVYREEFEKEREDRLESTLEALRDPDTRRSLAAKAAARTLAGGDDEEAVEETESEDTEP
jgi:hypothetical protein